MSENHWAISQEKIGVGVVSAEKKKRKEAFPAGTGAAARGEEEARLLTPQMKMGNHMYNGGAQTLCTEEAFRWRVHLSTWVARAARKHDSLTNIVSPSPWKMNKYLSSYRVKIYHTFKNSGHVSASHKGCERQHFDVITVTQVIIAQITK